MLKKLIAAVFAFILSAGLAFAQADVNKADQAALDGIKGIGPAMSEKIINERKASEFKDWNDFIGRVGGVGEKTAAKFSAEGLTVNGKRFSAAAQAKADKKKEDAKAKEKSSAKDKKEPKARKDKAAEPAAPAASAAK